MPSLITRSKFTSGTVSLEQSAGGHYNKQKLDVLDSGRQRIQWIKSTTSLKRETKRKKATITLGERQRTRSRGHAQENLQGVLGIFCRLCPPGLVPPGGMQWWRAQEATAQEDSEADVR